MYQLPFGKGRKYLIHSMLGYAVGGWQVSGTYELQPGPFIDWNNAFYYSNINDIRPNSPTFD